MNILMVLTSHAQLGNTDVKTGFWLEELADTHVLSEVKAASYDAVFYPGGHGPMWDLAQDTDSIRLIEAMLATGKPVAAVCPAPSALLKAKGADGQPIVRGKSVAGFSNTEEEASGLSEVVPFLVETMLTELGAHYSKAPDWRPHVVTDGLLVTGQNPASSGPAAKALLGLLTP